MHAVGPTRILHEGFGTQGVTGKAGGAIGRSSIALAMFRGGSVQMRSPVRPETDQDKASRRPVVQAEARSSCPLPIPVNKGPS